LGRDAILPLSSRLYSRPAGLYSQVVPILGHLEASEPFILEKHQIAQTICQVRFSPVLRLRQEDAVIPFQEAIRDGYPDFRSEKPISVILTPEGASQQESPDRLWRFVSAQDRFTVVLTTSFVALETSRYVDVDDLCSRLRDALALVQEHYAPAKATRVGLRFINEIRFDRKDIAQKIREAFNPLLLGVAGADEFMNVNSARQVVELAEPENQFLVRHGLHAEGGTTVDATMLTQPPSTKPFYLIDMDAYAEGETDFSLEGIDEKVRLYNDQMRSFFAWAVKEEFRRDVLGQKEGER
jgi:uncharacterized protein (TIGR04255 family)